MPKQNSPNGATSTYHLVPKISTKDFQSSEERPVHMALLNYPTMCHFPIKTELAGEEESILELPFLPSSTAALSSTLTQLKN